MTPESVMTLAHQAMYVALLLSAPLLLVALVVGLIVSLFQAATQINESTLTFIPKMIAVLVVLIVMAPWMLEVLQHYTTAVLTSAGEIIR